jgi:hypothetical protein
VTRGSLGAVLILGALLAGAVVSPGTIPYDMDEFAHYQPLGCLTHPLNREHNLKRESCGAYDLRLPFTETYLPLRSYLYIGSLPILPFYPFWRLLRDPVAARVQGVLYFWLAGLLVARLAGASPPIGILAGLVLPAYAFSFLVDTGPVGLSVLLLVLALLGLRDLGRRPSWLRGAGVGVLLFLGMLTKPVFAWALPAVAIYGVAQTRRAWTSLVAVALGFLPPLLLLALSVDRGGDRYLDVLRLGGVSPTGVGGVAIRFFGYVAHGSDILPRSLVLSSSPVDLLPLLLALILLAFALRTPEGMLFAGLGALTLAATLATGSAFWPHHFAYAWVFVTLAFASALGRVPRLARLTGLVVVLFLGTLLLRLPGADQAPESNAAKDRLIAYLAGLPDHFVEVHTSWGTFYIRHLFGAPDEEIVYLRFREWTDSRATVESVKALADQQGRGILVLTSRPEGLTRTETVEGVVGPPVARRRFGNWEVLEYLR